MSCAITIQLPAMQQTHEDEATYQEYRNDLELRILKQNCFTHENYVLQTERDRLNEIHKSTISDMLHREEILIEL